MNKQVRPWTPAAHEYVINHFNDETGEYSPSFTVLIEHKYLEEDKVLRILWQSDSPGEKDILTFIKEKYPQLNSQSVSKIYFDEPWHFTDKGSPYGIILVFF